MRIQDPLPESEGGIPEDEPVFLLRAKDKTAWMVVAFWAAGAELAGADQRMVQAAIEQADRMRFWPNQQVPDMPEA
jgi:hypothetical protein